MRTIIVSGYFQGDESDEKAGYFSRLDTELRKLGYKLYVINLNSKPITHNLEGEPLPILLQKAHWLPIDRLLDFAKVKIEVRNAASLDAACWHRPVSREAIRVILFREYLRSLILRTRASLVIAWHQFFSLHYSLPELLQEIGVPMLLAEFGPLPGSIIFDTGGQMAESPIARNNRAYTELPITDEDIYSADKFITKVKLERRSRKVQTDESLVQEALKDRVSPSQKIVFYAGQYDYRTGMTPRSLPNSKLHSPYFSDTHEALSFLSKIAKDRNWLILFKPHPLAEFPADLASRIGAPEFVQAVPGASIFECLEVAQVTTTIVSQVSYMSLIQDKPCVMMGRNYLSGKECTYEPQSQDEIAPAIDRAFAEGFTARQRKNWSRHVAQLLRYSVFGFDKDFSAPGLRPNSSAAEYLVSQCRDTNFDAKKTSLLEDIESSRTTALMLKLIERTATGMRFRRY